MSSLSFLAPFNLVGCGYFTGTGGASVLSTAKSTSGRIDKMGPWSSWELPASRLVEWRSSSGVHTGDHLTPLCCRDCSTEPSTSLPHAASLCMRPTRA